MNFPITFYSSKNFMLVETHLNMERIDSISNRECSKYKITMLFKEAGVLKRFKEFAILTLLVLLSGCSFSVSDNESSSSTSKDAAVPEVEYEAKATDFEDGGFTNNRGQLIIVENGELILSGPGPYDTKRTTAIDLVFKAQGYEIQPVFQAFQNAKISTEGDTYHITADDDVSIKFKKIGERIIIDEEGEEYFTKNYSK